MDHHHLVVRPNATFLAYYQAFVKEEWKRQYFFYDALKTEYKLVKRTNGEGMEHFEFIFHSEISRVCVFLQNLVKYAEEDLETLVLTCKSLDGKDKDAVELAVRELYQTCKDIEMFYKLNKFVINKISKKFEKLVSQHARDNREALAWTQYPSYRLYYDKFAAKEESIKALTSRVVRIYCDQFRQTHEELAVDELEFVKNKSLTNRDTKSYLGFKLGLILCLMLWLICDSNVVNHDMDFWEQAGLYVYTTAGNLLLFRITWTANIYLWHHYSINYVPLFGFHSQKSNLLSVLNQTTSVLLIFCINLMVFFRANTADSVLSHFPFLQYGCPLLLVVFTILYEVYDHSSLSLSASRGLFSKQVLINCLRAPFAALSFRDIYAADVLTSFTKVIADAAYSSCWLLSGAFLTPHDNAADQKISSNTDFGSSYMHCTGTNMVVAVGCIQCLPLIVRLLQCCRQYADSGCTVTFPFLFNALKYLLSIVVVLYGVTLSVVSKGNVKSIPYLVVIVSTTLYKWWWDCVMDWGLADSLPSCSDGGGGGGSSTHRNSTTSRSHSANEGLLSENHPHRHHRKPRAVHHWLLRPLLMYKHAPVYYLCVLLDLVLRFLWVVSLVPVEMFGSFVGPQLSFFLGSMEIVRRAMWGVFRLEYEHIKHVTKGTPGYLDHQHNPYRNRVASVDSAARALSEEGLLRVNNLSEPTSMPENNDAYLPQERKLSRAFAARNFVVNSDDFNT